MNVKMRNLLVGIFSMVCQNPVTFGIDAKRGRNMPDRPKKAAYRS